MKSGKKLVLTFGDISLALISKTLVFKNEQFLLLEKNVTF
jgi:hypothetical protein